MRPGHPRATSRSSPTPWSRARRAVLGGAAKRRQAERPSGSGRLRPGAAFVSCDLPFVGFGTVFSARPSPLGQNGGVGWADCPRRSGEVATWAIQSLRATTGETSSPAPTRTPRGSWSPNPRRPSTRTPRSSPTQTPRGWLRRPRPRTPRATRTPRKTRCPPSSSPMRSRPARAPTASTRWMTRIPPSTTPTSRA